MVLQEQLTRFIEFSPPGEVRGSISRRVELATFSHTQNPIIEIYLGTLQPRDFPYLPVVMF